LYAFYERNERMLDNTTRDAPRVPALGPSMRIVDDYLRAARRVLEQGRPRRGAAGRLSSAALGHALVFATWRSLVRYQGLDREQAVELMTKMVDGAG